MTRRFSDETRRWIYRYLCLRDGEKCYLCGEPPTGPFSFDIEHRNGDKDNKEPSNLGLSCRKCNVGKENRHRANRPGGVRIERDELTPNTRVFKDALPYHEGSPEMQANAVYENRVRRWVLDYVNTHGFISKKEAINAAAEIAGCNPSSAARYLAKMTSIVGPLMEEKDATGQEMVWARVLPKESQLALASTDPNQLPLIPEQEKHQ